MVWRKADKGMWGGGEERREGKYGHTAPFSVRLGMPVMQAVKYHVLTTNGVFHIYNELCFKCTR